MLAKEVSEHAADPDTVPLKKLLFGVLPQEWHRYRQEHLILVPLTMERRRKA